MMNLLLVLHTVAETVAVDRGKEKKKTRNVGLGVGPARVSDKREREEEGKKEHKSAETKKKEKKLLVLVQLHDVTRTGRTSKKNLLSVSTELLFRVCQQQPKSEFVQGKLSFS